MKKLLVFLCAMSLVFGMVVSAMAVPLSLFDITGYTGTEGYYDTGAEYVYLTDVDGHDDNVTAFLHFNDPGYGSYNKFGIYGFELDENGDVQMPEPNAMLEVFDGSQLSEGNSVTLEFDTDIGYVTNQATGAGAYIGPTFGFYLTPEVGFATYYSHSDLNTDGFDHMLIFDTSDPSMGLLLEANVVVAVEDFYYGGDQDFDDMVVGVTNVATATPEPATMLLFGSGLIGLAVLGRKKFFKNS